MLKEIAVGHDARQGPRRHRRRAHRRRNTGHVLSGNRRVRSDRRYEDNACSRRRRWRKETPMVTVGRRSVTLALAMGLAACAPWLFAGPQAQQASPPAVPAIDADDIGGVVTGTERPRGRRLGHRRDARPARPLHQDRRHRRSGPVRRSPICRAARYDVWARGYGLVDSAKSASEPGTDRERLRDARADAGRRGATTTRRSTGTRC